MESLVHVQHSQSGGDHFLPAHFSAPYARLNEVPLRAKPHCRSPRPYPLVRITGGEDAFERTRLGCTTSY
ncbi:uncharacterized protein ARMOST_15089 [Armillaria ostoyae]|uniref:Uncharacterized protein n=1 Tax=Armillaria ostoyae TaxID=47428 RepID=A0A284RSE8_ARMOS|nr:uncharacterized protein ARMOST_15089 [Armillaria ostoyae]